MAGIDADIKEMPMEMHTVIGQGGTRSPVDSGSD